MKKLIALTTLVLAFAAIARLRSSGPRLLERFESVMEACPPMVMMRRLGEQNEDMLALLREQTELLRRQAATEQATRQPV